MYFPYTCAWQFDRGLLRGDKVFVFSIQLVMGCKMPGPSERFFSPDPPLGLQIYPLGVSWGRPGVSWGVLVRLPLRSVPFGGAAPGGTSSVVERTIWG